LLDLPLVAWQKAAMMSFRAVLISLVLAPLGVHCGSTAPTSRSETDAAALDAGIPDTALPERDGAAPVSDAGNGTDAMNTDPPFAGSLQLPKDDPCRIVLAPMALALAEGIEGLANTRTISVSFTGSTFIRFYVVRVEGIQSHSYALNLSNDSSGFCSFESLVSDATAALGSDARTPATSSETVINPLVAVEPSDDACRTVSRYLAEGLTQSNLINPTLVNATVTRATDRPERSYGLRIDGKDFQVNGQTFANDHAFRFSLGGAGKPDCSFGTLQYAPL
jgi:hypothetical protein